MATLAESFLADLDELSDGDEAAEDDAQEEKDEGQDDMELNDGIEGLNYDDLSAVANLSSSERYNRIMKVARLSGMFISLLSGLDYLQKLMYRDMRCFRREAH
eukprot:scaffold75871_cov37-Prasinocladus_malaysianus.AAC.2